MDAKGLALPLTISCHGVAFHGEGYCVPSELSGHVLRHWQHGAWKITIPGQAFERVSDPLAVVVDTVRSATVTRLDIPVDDHDRVFTTVQICKMFEAYKPPPGPQGGRSRGFRALTEIKSKGATTLYLGGQSSGGVQLCVYDRQAKGVKGGPIRYEFRFGRKVAAAALTAVRVGRIAGLCASLVPWCPFLVDGLGGASGELRSVLPPGRSAQEMCEAFVRRYRRQFAKLIDTYPTTWMLKIQAAADALAVRPMPESEFENPPDDLPAIPPAADWVQSVIGFGSSKVVDDIPF